MTEYVNNSRVYPVVSSTGGKQQLTAVDIAFRQWVRATDAQREKQYTTFRDYYEGDHPTMLTKRLQQFLEVTNATLKFRANYMAIPVDIVAERLQVIGFKVTGEPENTDPKMMQGGEDGRLWQWWNYNRMDEEQGNLHTCALRDGDSYTLVEWDNDNDMPRIHHHLAFDGSSGMGVIYDEADKRRVNMAFKQWRIESGDDMGEIRRNIYYPGEVHKYVSGSGGWQLLDAIPWLDGNEPIGVPVFHYRNNGGGYDYGRSELQDLVPLQDSLNKAIIDLIAAADSSAFPEKVFESEDGLKPPEGLEFGPAGLLWGGKWTVLQPGDLSQLIGVIHDHVTRMAQISRTPLQYYQVTGQVASDDTQRAGDTGLVSKIENRAVSFGNTWEDVMSYCRKLHNIFGDGPELKEYPISTEWASFERVDKQTAAKTTAETQAIKEQALDGLMMKFPLADLRQLALLAGYTTAEAGIIAEFGTRQPVTGIEL